MTDPWNHLASQSPAQQARHHTPQTLGALLTHFGVHAMSLTPTSTRVLIVGGVVCAGTLWCARPTKDQAPTDDTLMQFGQYMIVTYVVTLAVALFLAAPSMSKSNTWAMHAGIIAFTSVGIFVEFCRFLTFGK